MWNRQLTPGAGALRRLCASAPISAALSLATRTLSTEEVVGEERMWGAAMEDKYGPGNYQLFRPLYKDLCDEIRREYYTKPPPPPPVARTRKQSSSGSGNGSEEKPTGPATSDAADVKSNPTNPVEETEGRDSGSSAGSAAPDGEPVAPEPVYGDGAWSVHFQPEHNVVAFRRGAVEEGRLAEIYAWSRVELKDPPRLNAVLTFADWIPIEICVVRNGVMLHFSMASNEGGMHMRNVRVYQPTSEEEKAALLDLSEDGELARKKFYYDGPCLWHLELDFQNELYDVMQDHGVSLDWVQWAASWVFYLEHVNYVKWNLGMLESLIPSSLRGPESDFLSSAEKALLEEPVEDWLEAHSM